jgi:hypothetical protein
VSSHSRLGYGSGGDPLASGVEKKTQRRDAQSQYYPHQAGERPRKSRKYRGYRGRGNDATCHETRQSVLRRGNVVGQAFEPDDCREKEIVRLESLTYGCQAEKPDLRQFAAVRAGVDSTFG